MWHSARWYVAAVVPSTEAEVVRGGCGTEALVVSGIEPGWYVARMLPMVVVFDMGGTWRLALRRRWYVLHEAAAAGRGVAVMMTFVIRRRCGRPPGQRA